MKKLVGWIVVLGIAIVAVIAFMQMRRSSVEQEVSLVDRGRYLVKIAGCNDCHTAGYVMNLGAVEESNWLMGDMLGWQGPWGTTYAINLRLYMQDVTEEQWLQIVQQLNSRPPMPYYVLQQMKEEDLRAIYRFVRSLGPAGDPAPPYLPPGVEPTSTVFRLVEPAQ